MNETDFLCQWFAGMMLSHETRWSREENASDTWKQEHGFG